MARSTFAVLWFGIFGALCADGAESVWEEKVDPWVLESADRGRETEFLVVLSERADLSGAAALSTKSDKGRYVFRRLTEVAERTQPPVVAALVDAGVEFRAYWIANMFWVRGGLDTVRAMAERSDVAHVYAKPVGRARTAAG